MATVNLPTVPAPWNDDGYMGVASGNTTCMVQPIGLSTAQVGDINITGTLTSTSQSGSAVKVGTLAGADADAENWIEQASTTKTALVLQAKASATDSVLEIQNSSAAVLFAVSPNGVIRSAGLTNPSNEMLLSSTALDMNGTNGTETTLYTVPAGRSMVPTRIVLRNASTSLTTASWSVGFNAGTDTDFRANATSTGLTGATKAYIYYGITTGVVVGAAAAVFAFCLNTQQGGASTATMDVFGYLI
jgi:hypothetical protein